MPATSRLCILVVGEPPAEIAARHGLFSTWFARLCEPHHLALDLRDGRTGPRPRMREYAGVVITGSPASLTEPEPWMEEVMELIREARTSGTPLFGVCFGHQLIGAAFGARVIANPAGWELATCEVRLTPDGARDPLFSGLPAAFDVNLCHRDLIDERTATGDLELLAGSERCAIQAVAAGDCIRGVQFHPEFSGAVTRAYIETFRADLAAEAQVGRGEEPADLLARTRDTPSGVTVFDNFVRHFVRRA